MSPRTRRRAVLVLGMLVLAWLPACQKQHAQTKNYPQDGMLGLSSVSPTLPSSPSYHTYNKDMELMKATINQIPHVTGSSISVAGRVANIRIEVPVDLPEQEALQVRKEAEDRLAGSMPRYKVNVAVSHK